MALDEHKELRLRPGDRVILSSRFIPGNERAIYSIINHVYRRGAEVFTTMGADIHVSGHGYRDDLETMLKLTKPEYFIPVHGEYRHLVKHLELARETGVPKGKAILLEDGYGIEFHNGEARLLPPIELNEAVVDGKELISIGSSVLKDRRNLSATGIIVAVVILDRHSGELMHGPEIFSKGMTFGKAADDVLDEVKDEVLNLLDELEGEARTDEAAVGEEIRVRVRRYFKNRFERKPVVIPIVLEV
jgi:ribonuclease J